jgi:hypothetical protein
MIINANANGFTNLSCSQWEDTMFDGTCHKKQVNVVLGNLVHLHYPGEVTRSDDTHSPETSWDDYALSPNTTYETAKGAVWSDFEVSFLSSFFKVLALTHLTLVMLEFKITEMIPFVA